MVYQQAISNTEAMNIDVSKFKKGLYLVAVQNGNNKTVKEIVIQ
jgi:hypothetical protein